MVEIEGTSRKVRPGEGGAGVQNGLLRERIYTTYGEEGSERKWPKEDEGEA